jgi:hypothetical protein
LLKRLRKRSQMASKPHIPESVLVRIWEEQRFKPDSLKTTAALPIQIIRRGQRNQNNGPDFQNVLIRIGDSVYEGDVELHLEAADWYAHGHHTDPNYNRTILHVVLWESERSVSSYTGVRTSVCPGTHLIRKVNGETVPTVVVQHSLSQSLNTLLEIFQRSNSRRQQKNRSCQNHIGDLPLEQILAQLKRLGKERLYERAQRFGTWLTQGSFQQLLYEAISEGLGYSSNKRPFVELARRLPIDQISAHLPMDGSDRLSTCLPWIQAMLFGTAGLLPIPQEQPGAQNLPGKEIDAETEEYVTELRSLWEMLRPCLHVIPMTPEEWHFFRLRPPNFPTRRIAALSYLLFNYAVQPAFENYLRLFALFSEYPMHHTQHIRLLERTLEVLAQGYWKGRYLFGKPVFPSHDRVFIGKSRIRDIIISAVFPVFLLYAQLTQQTHLEIQILRMYDIFPSPAWNRITKTMYIQLFANREVRMAEIRTARIYQGMLSLAKHYCYLPACTNCPFGRKV